MNHSSLDGFEMGNVWSLHGNAPPRQSDNYAVKELRVSVPKLELDQKINNGKTVGQLLEEYYQPSYKQFINEDELQTSIEKLPVEILDLILCDSGLDLANKKLCRLVSPEWFHILNRKVHLKYNLANCTLRKFNPLGNIGVLSVNVNDINLDGYRLPMEAVMNLKQTVKKLDLLFYEKIGKYINPNLRMQNQALKSSNQTGSGIEFLLKTCNNITTLEANVELMQFIPSPTWASNSLLCLKIMQINVKHDNDASALFELNTPNIAHLEVGRIGVEHRKKYSIEGQITFHGMMNFIGSHANTLRILKFVNALDDLQPHTVTNGNIDNIANPNLKPIIVESLGEVKLHSLEIIQDELSNEDGNAVPYSYTFGNILLNSQKHLDHLKVKTNSSYISTAINNIIAKNQNNLKTLEISSYSGAFSLGPLNLYPQLHHLCLPGGSVTEILTSSIPSRSCTIKTLSLIGFKFTSENDNTDFKIIAEVLPNLKTLKFLKHNYEELVELSRWIEAILSNTKINIIKFAYNQVKGDISDRTRRYMKRGLSTIERNGLVEISIEGDSALTVCRKINQSSSSQ